MKVFAMLFSLVAIVSGVAFADCRTADAARVINSSKVANISSCWTGYSVVIAKMNNGERVVLGRAEDALTKIRLAQMMQAQATDAPVGYSRNPTSVTICASAAFDLEWLTIGKSDCSGVWN
jgi:hypothetical protein